MTEKKYDLAVFIGRFQPFHNGHKEVIDEALQIADNILVLVGSCGGPRTLRNPFTFEERYDMIKDSYRDSRFDEYLDRIRILDIYDVLYNDEQWVEEIQDVVEYAKRTCGAETVTLIGHSKDQSSFYLKLFPQFDSTDVVNYLGINSTDIRNTYFGEAPKYRYTFGETVPESVLLFLQGFSNKDTYTDLRQEYLFIKSYKESWASAPYEPIFTTVDAVVVQSGHILLVQRRAQPGRGLWALPGGFLDPNEKIVDGMLRELEEETKIKVPKAVLKGSIVANKTFDDPYRSARGRTITHAYLIHLQSDIMLPKVKGSDDAAKAKWFPLSQVRREILFEDHYSIIENLTALL